MPATESTAAGRFRMVPVVAGRSAVLQGDSTSFRRANQLTDVSCLPHHVVTVAWPSTGTALLNTVALPTA